MILINILFLIFTAGLTAKRFNLSDNDNDT